LDSERVVSGRRFRRSRREAPPSLPYSHFFC
jgi:hypothetical protein